MIYNDFSDFIYEEPLGLREYEEMFISPDPDFRCKSKETKHIKQEVVNDTDYECLPRTKFIYDEKTGELREEFT